MCFARKRDHLAPLFISYNILPVLNQITLSACILAFKIHHSIIDMPSLLNQRVNYYNLRNQENWQIPYAPSTQTTHFIKPRTTKAWNDLPLDVKRSLTLPSFKRKIKDSMLVTLA